MKKIILILLVSVIGQLAIAQNEESIAVKLAQSNTATKKIDQLIVVYNENPKDNQASLVGLEKVKGNWKVKFKTIKASIGRNGMAAINDKVEGDGKSPSGIFELGRLFGYEATAPTSLHYTQSTVDDKWIDDSNAEDYNTYVRGNTNAKSFEHLLLKSIDYKYCMVIEYNTQPVVKGKGSAIFFHLADEKYTPTSGCVAIPEKNMLDYLQWLDPKKKRAILLTSLNGL